MTTREQDVLAAMRRLRPMGVSPVMVCRLLNRNVAGDCVPCAWCPVNDQGDQTAKVPRWSQSRVKRVLVALERAGLVVHWGLGRRRHNVYSLPKDVPNGARRINGYL